MEDLSIGIDLGTTNSCAALYKQERVKVLENSDGHRITPSFVYFTNTQQTIVGDNAKRQAKLNPQFGIYEIKRFVGRKFDDPSIQKNLQYLPFTVEKDAANEPQIVIKQKTKTVKKTPQEICTIILQKIKKDVEDKLEQPIKKAVITVPAYFDQRQREVTLEAAKAAGFTVLRLLNEPTAAALSYFFEKEKEKSTTHALVYDLGGGTFDVAILKKDRDNIDIVSVDGDTHLGGHDFDNLIVDFVCEELKRSYGYDAKMDKNNMRRLHNKCEEAKKVLSEVDETDIILNGVVPGEMSVQVTITRSQFESIADKLFKRSIEIVENCLKSSGISKSSINHVIMAGGSTRIPKIQKMLSDFFNGKKLSKFANPDECVAEGAALHAAMLPESSCLSQRIRKIKLTDVVSLSLGTQTLGNRMCFIIKRNTPIPTSNCSSFYTVYNRQEAIQFKIFEGERSDSRKNRFLGEVTISNLTPAPPRQCEVDITLAIDENGILKVTAKEKLRNNVKELTINYARSTKGEKEVQNALKDYEDNKLEDMRFEKFADAKAYLINYCVSARYNFEIKNLTMNYETIYDLCETTRERAESLEVDDERELRNLISRIESHCGVVVQKYAFGLMPYKTVNF